MKKLLAAMLLVVGSLFLMPAAFAEIQTYEGTGEYVMGDYETSDIAKERAKQMAIHAALEKAGVYLKYSSRFKNNELIDDEIAAIAYAIMEITDVEYEINLLPAVNSILIRATVKIKIDTDDVQLFIKKD